MSVEIPRAENDLRKAITHLEDLAAILKKEKARGVNAQFDAIEDALGLVFGALEALERTRVYGDEMPMVTPEIDEKKNIFRYGEDKN